MHNQKLGTGQFVSHFRKRRHEIPQSTQTADFGGEGLILTTNTGPVFQMASGVFKRILFLLYGQTARHLIEIRLGAIVMIFRRSIFSMMILMLVILAACHKPQHTSWSEDRVLLVANDTLREHHLAPESFDSPKPHFLADRGVWVVLFWPKSRVIGGDFMVVINDKTGKVEVLPGF